MSHSAKHSNCVRDCVLEGPQSEPRKKNQLGLKKMGKEKAEAEKIEKIASSK